MRVRVEYDRVDEYQREADARIGRELERGAIRTTATAQSLAPVDTGRLRASITWEWVGYHLIEVFTVVAYSHFVEWGTVHAQAQPYLRPSYERNYQQIVADISRALSTL